MKKPLLITDILQKVKKFTAVLVLIFLYNLQSFSQNYIFPTTGLQGTYIGDCPQTISSGNFFDPGGSGGNYPPFINNVEKTFSSATAGLCPRVTFTSFSMNDTYFLCFGPNSCCDYLQIYDGPTSTSPLLFSNCTVSPGTITSTTGSLTFRLVTDGSVQLAGWAATFSLVACGGPAANLSSDCAYAEPIFGSGAFTNATTGPGVVAEACADCSLGETYSHWYYFTVATSGTLGFIIDPNNNFANFDFAVFPANASCGTLGNPIRCSNARESGDGSTGLNSGAVDTSEDIGGNQFVSQMNVIAGETYKVLIDANMANQGFNLTFNGTATIMADADYTISTTGGIVIITDNNNLGETLDISENSGNIRFNVAGKTYKIDGGATTAFNTTPADISISGKTSITINAEGGDDIVNFGAFTTSLPSLNINGGIGNDNINFNGNITFTTNNNLNTDLQNDNASPGTDAITIATNTNLILSGTGTATLRASKNITVNNGAVLRTVNGALIAEANQQTTATTGDFTGIDVTGGTIEATGTGNVTIKGKGGNASDAQRGINVSSGGKIFGGTSGTLTVDGKTQTISGTNQNGVRVDGSTSKISSYGAAVIVNAKRN